MEESVVPEDLGEGAEVEGEAQNSIPLLIHALRVREDSADSVVVAVPEAHRLPMDCPVAAELDLAVLCLLKEAAYPLCEALLEQTLVWEEPAALPSAHSLLAAPTASVLAAARGWAVAYSCIPETQTLKPARLKRTRS
jgi:hypothetical protein